MFQYTFKVDGGGSSGKVAPATMVMGFFSNRVPSDILGKYTATILVKVSVDIQGDILDSDVAIKRTSNFFESHILPRINYFCTDNMMLILPK